MVARRTGDEPAFVLHRYDWSESSLILEVFTRQQGRVALAAKGAKRPSSNFRPVLLPLQPLRVSYGGDGEVRNLKGAEWAGGHVMPTGDALLAGYHCNELLLRLLARDDPHPRLFDIYAATVQVLASDPGDALEPALRAFELLLLRDVGLLPALDAETTTLAALAPDAPYSLVPDGGLVAAGDPGQRPVLPGRQWLALESAMQDVSPFTATLRAVVSLSALKPLLRQLLHYHCGVSTLRTRQLLLELQSL